MSNIYCSKCIYEAIRYWVRNCDSGNCECNLDRYDGTEIATKANNYDSVIVENKLLRASIEEKEKEKEKPQQQGKKTQKVETKTVAYIPIHAIDSTFALGIFADMSQAEAAIAEWLSAKHPTVVNEYEIYRESRKTDNKDHTIVDSILGEEDEDFWQSHGIYFTVVEAEFGKLFSFDDYDQWDSGNLHHLLKCLLASEYFDNGDRFNH